MEFQLKMLAKEYPLFFPTLANAIDTAYQRSDALIPAEMRRDPLCTRRLYGIILPFVDLELRRAIENAGFQGISVVAADNSKNSAGYLEIRTPRGIFVVAKVTKPKGMPHKAKYRQKYIDQIFMQEVLPGLEAYTPSCPPLYVITHVSARPDYSLRGIGIGRLTVDQRGWSCYYSMADLCKEDALVEKIDKTTSPEVREEVIEKIKRIHLKKA